MPENEKEMEKRGVACDCANHPDNDPKELTKTADGACVCPHCGKQAKQDKKKDLTKEE
jgi:hypothetical protein